MKPLRTTALLFAACLFASLTLTGCGWFNSSNPPAGDLPSDKISSLSDVSSSASTPSQPGTNSAGDATGTTEAPSSIPENQQDESIPMPAHSETPPTNDTAFNEVFARNPIDAHYNGSGAASVQEMVEIATECASLWQTEIDSAYQKLLEVMDASASKTLTSEQDKWLAGQQAELEKMQSKASNEEGSNAALVVANLTMQYYRERAAELYLKLYSYDRNFAYAYNG